MYDLFFSSSQPSAREAALRFHAVVPTRVSFFIRFSHSRVDQTSSGLQGVSGSAVDLVKTPGALEVFPMQARRCLVRIRGGSSTWMAQASVKAKRVFVKLNRSIYE